ncbi:MAG: hypothetical protein H6Q59_2887, partial [Firmicutes bacterium]|nr:hypothetical protein [Bacillota bacterium]
MDKDDANSIFDFDNDPEFSENFYKNIDNAFGESNVETPAKNEKSDVTAIADQEVTATASEITGTEPEKTMVNTASEEILPTKEDMTEADEFTNHSSSFAELSGDAVEDELIGINAALARQICDELDTINSETTKKAKKKKLMRIRNG